GLEAGGIGWVEVAETHRSPQWIVAVRADLDAQPGCRELRSASVEEIGRQEVGCGQVVGHAVPVDLSAARGERTGRGAVVRPPEQSAVLLDDRGDVPGTGDDSRIVRGLGGRIRRTTGAEADKPERQSQECPSVGAARFHGSVFTLALLAHSKTPW